MSLKTMIVSRAAAYVTGEKRLNRKRSVQESRRLAASAPHTVAYFHEAADPYSHLTAQVLADFAARYDVTLQVHLAGPPADWAAPERARLEAYAREDAQRLARRAGLSFADPGAQPAADLVQRANAQLAAAIAAGTFAVEAPRIGEQLWA